MIRAPTLLAALAGLVGLGSPAIASPTLMSDDDLAAARGGIETPLGLDIGFGATVRTYVGGQLALQTTLTWTQQGPVTEITGGSLAATGLPLSPGVNAVVAALNGGQTQVLQELTAGRIVSVITNSANNQNIRQDTDISLVLPQLPQLQQQLAISRMSASLRNLSSMALLHGAGN